MNRFSKIAFGATAVVTAFTGAAPSFAADHAGDGYHWEYTPGPRGTARRVADRPAKPATVASETGHWRLPFGPRGTATWIPADRADNRIPIERMSSDVPMTKAS